MKKTLSILLVLCMVFALMAGCGGGNSTPSTTPEDSSSESSAPDSTAPEADSGDKVVYIGVYEPASGDNGAGGKQEMLGMYYANSITPTVDIAGETYKVELIFADNQSSNDKAVSAATQLISGGASIILGSYGSGVSMAASDTFADAGIPALGVTCTNPGVTEGNDHYFRICFLDPFQGTVLASFAKEQSSATKAYCLAKQGDDYSVGLCNYFMQAFGKDNCVYETFPDGTGDYSAYVTSAKAQGCDVFFAPVSTEAAALIIDQAATQGLSIPMLAGDTWDSNVITEAAMGKDVNIYVTTFYQEGGDPDFDTGIKEWINSDPQHLAENGGNDMIAAVSAMGYDAYYVALEALKAAGSTDPADVMNALWDVQYDGVSGHIAFDDVNGDAIRDVAYVKHCDTATGTWEFVAVQGID
ncbi:MAG: ABC transporter substrate-binding protein [Oscillospiraceae bacterium]